MYGNLVNVQIMAGVTINDGVSPADSELTMYLEKATDFIDQSLKKVTALPLKPVPSIIDTIAEFYASGLFLARNNLPDGQTSHQNVIIAEKKLAQYVQSLDSGYLIATKHRCHQEYQS